MGKVLALFVCSKKGEPMRRLECAQALQGLGLEGDRYATGKGAWSRAPREAIRQVSLISQEAIAEANALLIQPFLPEETRRNILTSDIDLNALIGIEFTIGQARMRGFELCDPCARPSKLAGKVGFAEAFILRGGLRAEVLSSGLIVVGDDIV